VTEVFLHAGIFVQYFSSRSYLDVSRQDWICVDGVSAENVAGFANEASCRLCFHVLGVGQYREMGNRVMEGFMFALVCPSSDSETQSDSYGDSSFEGLSTAARHCHHQELWSFCPILFTCDSRVPNSFMARRCCAFAAYGWTLRQVMQGDEASACIQHPWS
jgi:hypothetical protein